MANVNTVEPISAASFWIGVAILLILGVAGVWDLYVAYRGMGEWTVSEVLRGWSRTFPMLPLFIGIVIGHILWSR